MYSLNWSDDYRNYLLIGEILSIFQLANILENRKTKFSVIDLKTGGRVSQTSLGYGGFEFWRE